MKKTLPTILLIVSLLLTGCGGGNIRANYREIEQIRVIQTIGLDSSDKGLRLTAASGKASQGSTPSVISREGESLVQAISAVQDYGESELLFFPHVHYLVVSESFARDGLAQAFDYVERDARLRMGTELFVLRGTEAKALITGTGSGDYNITSVLDALKKDVNNRGESHVFSLRETVRSLSENGSALVCTVRAADTEGSVFMTETGLTAIPDGYGILKDAVLVGHLNARDAVAASLLLNDPGSPVISVEDEEGGAVTLETTGGSASIHPVWSDDGGLESIRVEARLTAAVAEISKVAYPIENREYMDALERQLSADIKKRLLSVLDTSSRLDADFLGLGGTLRRDDWKNFDALGEDWLKNAVFDVSVETAIDRSYDLGDPMKTDWSGNK